MDLGATYCVIGKTIRMIMVELRIQQKTTLYNVCAVPWGDIMMHVGDILSTVGVFSTVGGYHPLKFGYHGGISCTCGGYHEYRGGCSVPWGTEITKDFSPTVLNTLHGTHNIPPQY